MIEVIPYTEAMRKKWDQFILASNNGTMFHMQQFFDYHTPGKFSFNHLAFFQNGEMIAALPGSLRNGVFESPVGASYGSLVIPDIHFNETLEIVDALIEYGKKNDFKEFVLTSAPMIYEVYQNQNLDFAMLWRGFRFDLHYISSAIKLDPSRDILMRCSPTIRRNIRKYINDPEFRVEANEAYHEFYPILLENKARHNVKPTHSLEDLYRLKELMPESLKLFMVYYKNEPIAGSLLFLANKTVAVCFYNMLRYDYQWIKPIQRVMYEVMKWSTENGFQYVDIGVSQDTKAENPMTPSMNLIDFKEKFDAKTIMRNTLRLAL